VVHTEEKLKLGGGLLQVQLCVVGVSLELSELKIDAGEVGGSNIAGVEAGLAEVYGLAIVGEVLVRNDEGGLSKQHVGEGLAYRQNRLALLITVEALRGFRS
jgi:hypothetical protein